MITLITIILKILCTVLGGLIELPLRLLITIILWDDKFLIEDDLIIKQIWE